MSILLSGVRILGSSRKTNILINNGIIEDIGTKLSTDKQIDLDGAVILPSLVDLHAHSRQPGDSEKEDMESFSKAAVHGGITALCTMPNTNPVIDNPEIVQALIEESKKIGLADILPVASITLGQKGKQLTEMFELKKAGVVAVSEDGKSVQDVRLMRSALEYAKSANMLVMLHSEEMNLSGGGSMNEGYASLKLGIKPIPEIAETIGILRDLELATYVGVKVHLCHVSLARSVEIISAYKKYFPELITSETAPHYMIFSEEDIHNYSPNFKMNPPLRTTRDRSRIVSALKKGKIDCIATDHAPHTDWEKENEFELAPFGITGLETWLPSLITYFVNKGRFSWQELVRLCCDRPREILGMGILSVKKGAIADLVVVDPNAQWEVSPANLFSKGKNTPFINKQLYGKVLLTLKKGKIVYQA